MDVLDIARGRRLAASGDGRAVRLAAKITLTELAAQLGVSPSTLLHWERGDSAPRTDVATRYSELIERLRIELDQ